MRNGRFLRVKHWLYSIVLGLIVASPSSFAQDRLRQSLNNNSSVLLQQGQTITLEVTLGSAAQGQSALAPYLAAPGTWRNYVRGNAALIPFDRLTNDVQRQAVLKLFPLDYVDASGWHHFVRISNTRYPETMKALCYWLTGSPDNAPLILGTDANRHIREPLQRGDRILFPQPFLRPVMKEHCQSLASRTPLSPPVPTTPLTPPKTPVKDPIPTAVSPLLPSTEARVVEALPQPGKTPVPDEANGASAEPYRTDYHKDLEYGEDREGPYAIYRLKPGESLYSAVVVRFTDYTHNADVLLACEKVAARTGIKNMHHVTVGQRIKIPADLLSDQYQARGTTQRESYENIREEGRRLQAIRTGTRDLEGVVVVLDPGHGGIDPGAIRESDGLYEDEINYDIACRIKGILETTTRAQVYMTLEDPSQGFRPSNNTRFVHDKDERILTTPKYLITNKDVANNLRWYLANSIYYEASKQGANPQKIIFDSIYDETVRGMMVYVPGTAHRKNQESHTTGVYAQFEEVRKNPVASSTASQRVQDEALSRTFAETLTRSLRAHNPPLKVHSIGNPIRSEIRRSGGKSYLPTVLRNTAIPTKVLIEVANMNNSRDRQHLSNPDWRQWFAESFVDALRSHYNK